MKLSPKSKLTPSHIYNSLDHISESLSRHTGQLLGFDRRADDKNLVCVGHRLIIHCMIGPVSEFSEHGFERLDNTANPHYINPVVIIEPVHVPLWNDPAFKPHRVCFARPQQGMASGAHLTGKP